VVGLLEGRSVSEAAVGVVVVDVVVDDTNKELSCRHLSPKKLFFLHQHIHRQGRQYCCCYYY
jgi:hypothetical protein